MKDACSRRPILLPILVVLLFVLVALFHLASAAKGYPFYRDQHLGAAFNYARDGIDFLRPVIPGFDANKVGTPLEPPLWQAFAAMFIRGMHGSWMGGNIASLFCFALGLWPFWKICEMCLGPRGAWWGMAAFLTQPLVVLIAGQASADGLSLGLAIWFFYAALMMVRTGNWCWLPLTIVAGALAATAKLPLFMAAGAGVGFVLVAEQRTSPIRWTQLTLAGLVSAGIFFWWNRLTTGILLSAEYPQVKLWMKDNPALWWWYFGDWAFRLNPMNWIKGGWAALNCLFGSFALAGLFLVGLFQKPLRPALCWLGGAVMTMLIFSHLVLVHRHYFTLFSPAVALLAGAALALIEEKCFEMAAWTRFVCAPALMGLLLLGSVQGLMGMEVVLNYDPYYRRMADIIRAHAGENEKIVVQNGGWGQMLMLSGRDGLNTSVEKTLADPSAARDLHQRGFTKLVVLSESPLLWALKKTNPGAAGLERETYRKNWMPVLDSWPTEYQDENIVIKRVEAP